MGLLKFTVIVMVMLCFSCSHQVLDDDQHVLILKNIVNGIDRLEKKFEELCTKMTSVEETQITMAQTLQDHHTKLISVEEKQLKLEETLRVQVEENQRCVKEDQIEAFQNVSESGQQEMMASLQQSSCKDQLLDFQDLLSADECMDGSHNCSESSTCTDSLILYKCDCLPGYSGDGFTCTDIDECNGGSSYFNCSTNEKCGNIPGTYECLCQEGYEKGDTGCQDIDECNGGRSYFNCSTNEKCGNIPGTYECLCQEGYEKGDTGCQDIDECNGGEYFNCSTNEKCVNILGTYECLCQEGYEKGDTGCQDINECEGNLHQCQSFALCVNNDGGYKCQCPRFYKGNGTFCELDCESPSFYVEDLGCIIPILTRLTWMDAKEKCEASGTRLLEDLRREHFEPLSLHFEPLMTNRPYPWIGFKNMSWISNGHLVPKEVITEGTLNGDCGNFDLTPDARGLWDGNCSVKDFALCQEV